MNEKSEVCDTYQKTIEEYRRFRSILLWALEHYFADRHLRDLSGSTHSSWDALRAFAEILAPNDLVITFNYDATVERVLLSQGKWSPRDGYGFDVVLQQSRDDKTIVDSRKKSDVIVLHLHGATGWYPRPPFAPGYQPQGSGAVPSEVFGPAPMNTHASLDPQFLRGLGIQNVDACLPDALPVSNDRHVVLHPSFFKNYLSDEGIIAPLWRRAAAELRSANRIFIVGYSLPKADSAALTLLLSNCATGAVRVINLDGGVKMKLGRLLQSGDAFEGTATFQDWVAAGCPDRIPWRPKMQAEHFDVA